MEKRVIKFYGWVDYMINDSKPFEEQVEFEWDGIGDGMVSAYAALEKAMEKDEDMIEFRVSDWDWIK